MNASIPMILMRFCSGEQLLRGVRFAGLGLVFAASSWASIALNEYFGQTSAIWITNALVVASMVRVPTRQWCIILPLAVAAICFAHIEANHPSGVSVVLALLNAVEVLAIAVPLRVFGLDQRLMQPFPLAIFYFLALGPATMLPAALAGLALHAAAGIEFWQGFWHWYAADAMGLAAVGPLAMLLRPKDVVEIFKPRKLAVTTLLILLMLGVLFVMREFKDLPVGFLLFPVFLLITFLRSYGGIAIAVLLAGAAVTYNLSSSEGFLAVSSMEVRGKLGVLQLFVAVLGATALFFESALAERRALIEKLRAASLKALTARDHAEQANLAKSSFLANMSHELRTPLNAILGYSEIMRDGLLKARCEGECREHSKVIHGAGSHLLSIINDILDMSKIEAGKFDLYLEEVDPAVAVRDSLGLLEVRLQRGGLSVVLEVPDQPVHVRADSRALRQIILNLLSNAIKFTPPGGKIFVSVATMKEELKLSVRDTGVGIPAKDLPRLGIPFEQVRSGADVAHSGTGLGLALVSALAQKHGGSMKIESEEGAGTTVTITLPVGVQLQPVVSTAAAE